MGRMPSVPRWVRLLPKHKASRLSHVVSTTSQGCRHDFPTVFSTRRANTATVSEKSILDDTKTPSGVRFFISSFPHFQFLISSFLVPAALSLREGVAHVARVHLRTRAYGTIMSLSWKRLQRQGSFWGSKCSSSKSLHTPALSEYISLKYRWIIVPEQCRSKRLGLD